MSEIEKNKIKKSLEISSNKKTILFLDSGIGGLHILKECVKLSPEHNYIYIADTINAPYGNKRKKELVKIADKLVCELNKEFNPDIIVLACNSLTVSCINFLRNKYKKIFVGIEPALKQAKLNGGDIIIFATKTTLKSYHKLNKKCSQQLKKEHKKQNLRYYNKDKVYKIFIPDLPLKIDKNCNNLEALNPILIKEFDNLEYKKINNLVLGCTHYIAIKPQLKQILKDVQIFDGAIPVAKRLQSLLKENKNIDKNKNQIENSVIKNETLVKQNEDFIKKNENSVKKVQSSVKEIQSSDEVKKQSKKTSEKFEQFSEKTSKKFKLSQIKFISLDGNPSTKSLLKQYFIKIYK